MAASVPLAVGAALSSSVRGSDQVAVALFGDGGANQGVLHESMNLASVWDLPVIFVCENNLFAESTPAEYALSVPNVADRAAGYGMPGERARSGQGPSLLECKTYRYYGHTVFEKGIITDFSRATRYRASVSAHPSQRPSRYSVSG